MKMKPLGLHNSNTPVEMGESDYFCPPEYRSLIDSMEYNVLVEVTDDDYQGDSRFLLKDPSTNKYGYLIFGWGSCSGCDALEDCHSIEEVTQLRDELHAGITWFTTKEETKMFFETHDWKGDYMHEEDTEEFVKIAMARLEKE